MRRLPILLLLAVLLAGCGQKGPLYQPDNEAAAERYAPPDESATERDDTTTPERAADEEGD
ncbi:LPS translocon maturation chaperone LptM [Halomonas caseinilytica]|uniref:Predicted small lipoprotein YifL n=1 Tax=Halomonas caseinilytica TaxID=438744 RepID=A0A1M6W0Z0_9GAMM|nr:lipoprotein [Halomonas caseinilytica]SEM79234.1 Predicted small lipoprotein YifL [Halomonas caseinilytica]SHK87349.1 Predicted small lipoprotein YifL [Halomonas caseinilytica]